jgi:hypothetical protein
VIEDHASCLQHLEDIMTHYFGWMAFRQGQFIFGAQREETVLREIVLDDAVEGGEPTFNLPGERDTKNRIRVDYTDRSRRYNTMSTHVGDDPDRAARGERAENLRLPWFATVARARAVAAKMLALKSVPRAGYEMTLGPKEIALAPGDVVALTASQLGLSQEPVRIVAIGESEDRAEFRLTVISEPSAVLALRTYPIQPLNPGDHPGPPSVDPGPTLFAVWEVPPELSGEDVVQTAFILAGTGNPEWRGASVYMSLDGTNYSRVATVLGANGEIGRVTAGRDAGPAYEDMAVVDVDLSLSLGSLLSTTRNMALAGASLALAGQQHLSYRQAELQSAHRYRLRGLMRGWFEQSQVHITAGDNFVTIGEYTDLPTLTHPHSRIGSTMFFKAVSINRFGVEQSLADAQAVQVTLQGLARRPSPVYGLQAALGGVAQGSRTVIGTGQIDVSCRWRYARRDNPEDADLVDGLEVAGKHGEFLDYRVQVYTRASSGDAWGLRRTVFQTGETFTYTAAQNIADNGSYHRFVRFDVTVRRANGVMSVVKTLAVEVII